MSQSPAAYLRECAKRELANDEDRVFRILPELATFQAAADDLFAQDSEIGLVHVSVHNGEARVDKDTFFALWDAYRALAAAIAREAFDTVAEREGRG